MNQKPIFIFGVEKSGTSLLRSLLDGHPDIFAIPFETHFFQLKKFWVDFDYRKERPPRISAEKLKQRLIQWIHIQNTEAYAYADSDTRGLIDEKKFKEAIATIQKSDSIKEQLEKYFLAIYKSITKNDFLPDDIRIVEKSVEHAGFAMYLFQCFPEAKFIHTIRNPYSNIVSFRKFKSKSHGFALMPRILKSMYNNYYFLYRNRDLIENYYIIRYEDLVSNPIVEIKKLCQFLELPFEEILLTPTIMGKPWRGNSVSGEQFSGIVSTRLESWREEILPMEICYVNQMFPFILDEFGYKKVEPEGSFWKKGKGEPILRYLYNRFYKYYSK